jgi:4a-hydroxytetrahydrobiopterin dehydratase
MAPAHWKIEDNCLKRGFEFKDFKAAFSFLTAVANLAEEHHHHPEIWNVYNKVHLSLSTHDAGNLVTQKDVSLAEAINKLL